jgi:hypothetical protein
MPSVGSRPEIRPQGASNGRLATPVTMTQM